MRCNNSTQATFTYQDLSNPFSEGAFRWVAKGHYTKGDRKGENCVCKRFKEGSVCEEGFFDLDIKADDKAIDLARNWNTERFVNKTVMFNRPEVWTFEQKSNWAGQKAPQEPYITDYQKFNSNSGWSDLETPWHRVMQAVSHYIYHKSGGQYVLCDLQGGIYKDGAVMSDPVILSRNRSLHSTNC